MEDTTAHWMSIVVGVGSVRLKVQCEVVELEVNHIFPAFSVARRECGLPDREPLLFSCAGFSAKIQPSLSLQGLPQRPGGAMQGTAYDDRGVFWCSLGRAVSKSGDTQSGPDRNVIPLGSLPYQ
ncbi:hypothetical protein NFI96_004324, partial [Prochilodus magdalenae]